MQKPKNQPSLAVVFTLALLFLFAANLFILYPQDFVRSLLYALIFAPLVVLIEYLTRRPKRLLHMAGRVEQLVTEPAANKKDRAKKIAIISIFFAGFTTGNALLLEVATNGSDPRILTASPIVGAIYTYVFIKILRRKRKHFNRDTT